VLFTLFYSSASWAQVDMTKYFIPTLGNSYGYTYLKVDFKWDMNGDQQAFINEGINSLEEDNVTIALVNLNKAIKLDSSLWMSHYYRGICHRKTLRLKDAEQDFKTALSLNPALAEAEIELAKTYLVLRNFKEAEKHLDAAIQKKPTLAEGYFNKGILEATLGNLTKGRKLFEKANEVDSKHAPSYLMRGLMEWGIKHDYSDAIELFDKATAADSTFLPGYFWRGIVRAQKDPKACLQDWNRVIQLDPGNTFFTIMRGYLYIEIKNFDMAFIDFKNAVKSQTVNEDEYTGGRTILDYKIELHAVANYLIATGYGLDEAAFTQLKKGFCLLLAGNKKEALQSINEAEKIQSSATVYYLKAILLENYGQQQEAFEYYTLTLSMDNDIFDAHRKKCVYYFEKIDYKNVHVELREMFRLQPSSPVGHRLRGMVRFSQGSYGPAIGDFNEFIKKDSFDTEVIRTRAKCYTSLGKLKEANQDIEWLMKRNPSWEICEEAITNYLVLRDTTQAIAVLEKFLEPQPIHYAPHLKIVELYISQKNWTQAKIKLDKVSTIIVSPYFHQAHAQMNHWRGLIELYHEQNPKGAIANFDAALKLNPQNLEAKYHRAKALLLSGQQKKAITAYEELKGFGYRDSEQIYSSLLEKKG
jgi:tetratricopeptide (TPR) repeat protein